MASSNPLLEPAVATIPEAVARLDKIQDYIVSSEPGGVDDGVACFNFLYHRITARVHEKVQDRFFADERFIPTLDVVFANRYLDALRISAQALQNTPDSWRVLVKRRANRDIAGILFAVAGVNAHVNFDLPAAVVETCEQLNVDPDEGEQWADYRLINEIFEEEMEELRQHFLDKTRQIDDRLLAPVLNAMGNFKVVVARDAAWNNARLIWGLRGVPFARKPFLERLDNLVGLAGHLILTPVPGLADLL